MRQSYHYPLPPGLEVGMLVKLISYDHGYWTVEADGKQFVVFGPQVDAGFLYELNGRWLPADNPAVMARKREETLTKSPAYSSEPHNQFVADLAFDSLDSADLLIDLEEKFGFEFPDEAIEKKNVTTVLELVIAINSLICSAD